MNNIPPAFLLTAADLYLTEVPAGALGGGGTQWLRSASFGHFSEDVPDHPGLVRLRWLGALYFTRMPWRPQQAGALDKRLGGKRLVVNASFPHNLRCDDMGARIFSLNDLSRRSYDEVRGADATRMSRAVSRLRVTAGSPPPSSPDVTVVPWRPKARSGPGRVLVVNASSAPVHPCPIYGGRGSLLGNPLCMSCEDDRDASCDGYADLLGDEYLLSMGQVKPSKT
jgi:hypothetical protein